MAVLDYFIVGILTFSMLFSIRRGFVKEALSLLTWIAAVVVSRLFAGHLSVLLESQLKQICLGWEFIPYSFHRNADDRRNGQLRYGRIS